MPLVRPMLVFWLSLSLFGRITSMISGPIPVAVFQAASQMSGTWANCALNMCHSLGAPLPNACGVTSGSPPSVSRRWFESRVRHLLDGGLHNRGSGQCVHFPPSAFSVGGSSPDHARAWGLARWDHDHVQKIAQPSICSCLSHSCWRSGALLVSVHGSKICERIGAADVAFQSKQLLCGRSTRGFSTQLHSSIPQGRCALIAMSALLRTTSVICQSVFSMPSAFSRSQSCAALVNFV